MAMVFAGRMSSACGMYLYCRCWQNINKRADAAIYNAAVFNYHICLNSRNGIDGNPCNEDVAVYAVIKNQISL